MALSFRTPSERWHAITIRNHLATNSFIYAVHTTKIYCRPTCPARLARRANVSFFDTATQAQAAGFRACKRCKPESGDGLPEDAAVKAVRAFVRDEGGSSEATGIGNLGKMAERAGVSKWHFHRTFVRFVGVTPGEWVKRRREGKTSEVSAFGTPMENNGSPSSGTSPGGSTDASSDIADFGFEISEEEWEKMICFEGFGDLGAEFEKELG